MRLNAYLLPYTKRSAPSASVHSMEENRRLRDTETIPGFLDTMPKVQEKTVENQTKMMQRDPLRVRLESSKNVSCTCCKMQKSWTDESLKVYTWNHAPEKT